MLSARAGAKCFYRLLTSHADPISCGTNSSCHWISIMNQFAASSADVWYLLLSVDLYLALRNPFTVQQVDTRRPGDGRVRGGPVK